MIRILRTLTLGAIVFGANLAVACKVPVFRYALERWEADDYRAVIIYRGAEKKGEVERLIAPFREAGAANVRMDLVDAESLTDAQVWQFGDLDDVGPEPVLRVHFPAPRGQEEAFWEGALTAENVALVRDSPARRALAELLLGGASAVWVYVSDGEVAGEAKLREELTAVAAGMELPEGVLRASELLSGGVDALGEPVEMDDVLRTDIPFRIDFPVLKVDRNDQAEAVFLAMLLHDRGGIPPADVAYVVPVFGRGRMIEALPFDLVETSRLERACAYLCGECSCQVKDENPGADLLLAVDWKTRLHSDIALVERQLQALPNMVKPETVTFGSTAPSTSGKMTTTADLPWYLVGGLAFILALGALAWRQRVGGKG
jgi:hypothetical protein